MLVEHDLLETLCCPVSKWPLRVMTPQEVQEVNTAIVGDRTSYADGARVTEPMEGALATIDEASVYAIREGVPALLPELRIVRGGNAAPVTGAIPGTPREGPAADYWAELSGTGTIASRRGGRGLRTPRCSNGSWVRRSPARARPVLAPCNSV